MAMTKHDLDILNRCHDDAVNEMSSAASAIADVVVSGYWPSAEQVARYRIAKKKADSTRADIENCLKLELEELLNT